MPTMTIKNGKVGKNVIDKIIFRGLIEYEIPISTPTVVTAKHAFCYLMISEHFFYNREKYSGLDDIMAYISNNFTHVELGTINNDTLEGIELNKRALNKIRKLINIEILLDYRGLRRP